MTVSAPRSGSVRADPIGAGLPAVPSWTVAVGGTGVGGIGVHVEVGVEVGRGVDVGARVRVGRIVGVSVAGVPETQFARLGAG